MSIIIMNDYMKRMKKKELSMHDNPHWHETVKIGREIIRAKQLGHKRVEEDFGADTHKILSKRPEDRTIVKEITKEYVDKIKSLSL